MPATSGSKGKKTPPKNPGKASVNPVEDDTKSTDSGGDDTDALSHLPTDDESDGGGDGPGETGGNDEDQ